MNSFTLSSSVLYLLCFKRLFPLVLHYSCKYFTPALFLIGEKRKFYICLVVEEREMGPFGRKNVYELTLKLFFFNGNLLVLFLLLSLSLLYPLHHKIPSSDSKWTMYIKIASTKMFLINKSLWKKRLSVYYYTKPISFFKKNHTYLTNFYFTIKGEIFESTCLLVN